MPQTHVRRREAEFTQIEISNSPFFFPTTHSARQFYTSQWTSSSQRISICLRQRRAIPNKLAQFCVGFSLVSSPCCSSMLQHAPTSRAERCRLRTACLTHCYFVVGSVQPELQPDLRRKLLFHLLTTLSTLRSDRGDSPAQIQLLSTLLALVKFLGRSAAGSEALAREDGLRILLQHGGLARSNEFAPLEEYDDERESNDDRTVEAGHDPLTSYESEALRCLCNTLTLHPGSRDVFSVVLSENSQWTGGIVRLLEMQGAGFLAGRLLFLLTSKASDLVIKLGDEGAAVKSITAVSQSL